MSQQWDAVLSEIAKKTADKWGIPTDQGKLLVDTYTSQNLKTMRKNGLVIWINIGKFYLNPVRTVRWLLKIYNQFREGLFDREELKERIVKYYPIHQTARKHAPRTGASYRFRILLKRAREEGRDMREFFKLRSFASRHKLYDR